MPRDTRLTVRHLGLVVLLSLQALEGLGGRGGKQIRDAATLSGRCGGTPKAFRRLETQPQRAMIKETKNNKQLVKEFVLFPIKTTELKHF